MSLTSPPDKKSSFLIDVNNDKSNNTINNTSKNNIDENNNEFEKVSQANKSTGSVEVIGRSGEVGTEKVIKGRKEEQEKEENNVFANDVKIAVIGNVDSGKSTLVGVLTKHALDDGRGLARSSVFNFSHESLNGRTSSIAQEIMGFKNDSVVPVVHQSNHSSSNINNSVGSGCVNANSKNTFWREVIKNSSKLITFLDLCGHEKYLKTTIFGLLACLPDYAMVVVGANMGVQRMTKEHMGITLALRLPFFLVVTKFDLAPENVFKSNLEQILKLLKSNLAKKMPLVINAISDVEIAATAIANDRICPIFVVSNVTGEGLDLLRNFLSRLKNRVHQSGWYKGISDPCEFYIEVVYVVPGVGFIVSGTLKSGQISVNQQLLLGPDRCGSFKPVVVRSIHAKRVAVSHVFAGQTAALALRSLVKKDQLKRSYFRKGMVLLDKCLDISSSSLPCANSSTSSSSVSALSTSSHINNDTNNINNNHANTTTKSLLVHNSATSSISSFSISLPSLHMTTENNNCNVMSIAKGAWEFEAECVILHHSTTIKANYQAVIHCGVVRQIAKVKHLNQELLRTGDRANIVFRFMYHSEYLTLGAPLIFREGRTKGLGKICNIFYE